MSAEDEIEARLQEIEARARDHRWLADKNEWTCDQDIPWLVQQLRAAHATVVSPEAHMSSESEKHSPNRPGDVDSSPPIGARPWRVGRKVGRTIYDAGDRLIGVMDRAKDAAMVVEAVNAQPVETSHSRDGCEHCGGSGVSPLHGHMCGICAGKGFLYGYEKEVLRKARSCALVLQPPDGRPGTVWRCKHCTRSVIMGNESPPNGDYICSFEKPCCKCGRVTKQRVDGVPECSDCIAREGR